MKITPETRVGWAFCGSFCTMNTAVTALERFIAETGAAVTPIMSGITRSQSTRFGEADYFAERVESACGRKILSTVAEVEPIGPKSLLDLLIIAPCTGNTLAKLASGIADTSVTMAAKAHLRGEKPVLIALSTNDALSGAAANIGTLLNRRSVLFVPFGQDAPQSKPRSCVADFTQITRAAEAALDMHQLQPVLLAAPGDAKK